MKARLHVRPIAVLLAAAVVAVAAFSTSASGAGGPAIATPPTIAGTAKSGETLTATTGTWATPPTSVAYAWQRCSDTGTVVRGHRRRLGRHDDDLRPDLGRRRPDRARRRDGDRRRRHDGFALGSDRRRRQRRGSPEHRAPDRLGHHDRGPDPRRHRRHVGRCGTDHVHVCLVALRRDGWRVRADRGRHGQDLPARRSRQRQDAALVGDGQEHARQPDRDVGADRRGRPAQPAQRRDAADAAASRSTRPTSRRPPPS